MKTRAGSDYGENNIIIKRVTVSEVDELQKLAIKTFFDAFSDVNTRENIHHYMTHYLTAEKFRIELRNPESEFYFSKLDEVTIGYLKVNYGKAQTELQDPDALEIERIYVTQEYQGFNIGKHLLDKAIHIARERKVNYIWLGVWENNLKALKFYQKNGFVQFSSHPFKLGDDVQTDLLMKLVL